jgi:hypothetical protein
MSAAGGLPPISDASLPASVRSGSARERKEYRAAAGFEQVLIGQLVQELLPEDSELSEGPYASTIQDSFAQGIAESGGFGLAGQLFETMQRTHG